MRASSRDRGVALTDLLLGLLALVVIAGVVLVLQRANDPPKTEALSTVSTDPTAAPSSASPNPSPDGPVPFRRGDTTTRVLFIGDGITRGEFADSAAEGFVALTTAGLSKDGPVTRAVAASVAAKASTSSGVPPDLALTVIELGTNDVDATPIAAFQRDYAAVLARVRAASPSTAIVCLGVWADAAPFDQAIQTGCQTYGGVFLPISDYFANPVLHAAKGHTTDGGTADGVLPGSVGHERISGRLLRAITRLTG